MPHECTNCGRTFPDGSKEMLSGCPECGGRKFKFEPANRARRQADDDPTANENAETGSSGGFVDHAVEAAEAAPDRTASGETTASDESLTSREWPDHPDVADSVTDDQSGQPPASGDDQRSTSETSNTSTNRPGAQTGTRPHAGVDPGEGSEDRAQADARSAVVPESELPDHGAGGADGPGDTTDGDTTRSDTATDDTTHPDTAGENTTHPDAASQDTTEEPPVTDQRRFEALREELNEQFESIRIVRPGEYELNLVELYDREEFIVSLREDGRYVIEMPDAWGSPDD
jgi:predicted  nucleic acid-binding Zn-ribbon protein